MTDSTSRRLAQRVVETSFDDLPEPVVHEVERHVIDLVGVAVAASTHDFARAAIEVAEEIGGAPEAAVVGTTRRLPAAWAAFANGTLAHGLDFDDTHTESVVHVSTSVVPCALACGEKHGVGGRDFLLGAALGMEANVRLGLVARGAFHDRGFHPTGICGAYASALVAAKLAGLAPEPAAHAMGIAGSQAAGSLEFLTDGTWAKRIHGGWAAHAGIVAAMLAERGFSGPIETLEGRFGLYRSHLGEGDWDCELAVRDWGERWHLLDIGLKPYPCCHYNHAFLDCARTIRRAPGFRAEEIEAVGTFLAPREMPIICEPQESKREPQTDYDAKFSLPYTVASMLVRGHVGIDDFTDAAIRDEGVLRISRLVTHAEDPQSDFPRRFPGWLRVRLRDGTVLEAREPINRGSAEKPLDDADVAAKFRANVAPVLGEDRAVALLARLHDLRAPRGDSLDIFDGLWEVAAR